MPPPETPKEEFFFDKWLTGATLTFEALVFAALTALEDDAPPRQRKRHDLATYEALVTTAIANLAYPIKPPGWFERHPYVLMPGVVLVTLFTFEAVHITVYRLVARPIETAG